MSDETEKAEDAGPLGGERLRAARRKHNISVRDIAKELHLDEAKVRALEKNQFDVLGPPVFAKGHLRKYADLVGVSIDDVMTDYYQMNRSAGAPPVVGVARPQQRDFALGPWIGGGVALIVIVAAAYWWFTREPTVPASNLEPAILAPFSAGLETDVADADQDSVEPVDSDFQPAGEDDNIVVDPAPANVAVLATEAANVPPSTAEQVRIDLSFSGDCWTEVSDASGRRLYYDLGQAGSVITLSGDAPLRVILGDSANVSIKRDGLDFPIPADRVSGRLARLTINSS